MKLTGGVTKHRDEILSGLTCCHRFCTTTHQRKLMFFFLSLKLILECDYYIFQQNIFELTLTFFKRSIIWEGFLWPQG